MINLDEAKYEEAKKRVKRMKGFYMHLIVYIIINTLIVIKKTQDINDPYDNLWDAFKLPFFWGIGLIFHGLRAFDSIPFIGKDWEEKKIKEIMDKKK